MEIIDIDAVMNAPSSKFLKKEEFKHLYGQEHEHLPHRKNYIFKHKIPLNVNDEIGYILLKKYPRLKRADGVSPGKYTRKSYTDLKKIAMSLGYAYKDTMIKKEDLRKMVIAKEQEVSKNGDSANGV